MSPMQNSHNHHHGFTVVEVLVVAPIVILTIAAFIGVLVALTGEALIARSSNSLALDTQRALSMIEQDIHHSGSFLATNSLPLTAPQGRNNSTAAFVNALNGTNPQGTALILNMIATTGSENPATKTPVWLRDSPHSCANSLHHNNTVMTYNVVYFIDTDGALWRRVIMPSNYAYSSARCTDPDQRPSCAPDRTESICIARDARVLDNVTSLTIDYFATASSTTPVANASKHTVSIASRNSLLSGGANGLPSAQISITSAKTVAGKDISYSSSLRATRSGTLIRD